MSGNSNSKKKLLAFGNLRHDPLNGWQGSKFAMAMGRQEAAMVLREILGECDRLLLMSGVSLWPVPTNKLEFFFRVANQL